MSQVVPEFEAAFPRDAAAARRAAAKSAASKQADRAAPAVAGEHASEPAAAHAPGRDSGGQDSAPGNGADEQTMNGADGAARPVAEDVRAIAAHKALMQCAFSNLSASSQCLSHKLWRSLALQSSSARSWLTTAFDDKSSTATSMYARKRTYSVRAA